ncbi:hypothetical protein [Auraticoccus monumenti]|uniref:Four helix bundle sensory module for signal transduction n=1 Tax=Auraticoccus monumenti TaxID=675864 RepID=A0A1G7AIX4_9ACTN|nr:hypothetical protein [Auraticoccus monumenti]SDE14693.1 hypothetical protein SAMN04489747_2632 [Auraticoccus monumenti]
MSQQPGLAGQQAPPAGTGAPRTATPAYLQQRVAFPARASSPGGPKVITRPGQTKDVGSRLSGTSTPRLLLALMALCAAAVLLFGTAATTVLVSSAGAMDRASHNAQQLVRVQNIKAQLLRADALATNAFLVGGLESAQARSAYDDAVDDAAGLLVQASEAQPADAEALRVVNSELVLYSTSMAQARANNRQGYPVGASYLNQASAQLRERAVPALDAMAEANTQRIARETGSGSLVVVVVVGVLALAVLGWTLRVVALRFRRTVNVGLAVAAAMVLLGLLASVGVLASLARTVDDLEGGALNGIRQLSAARTAGYDAKALESLTLISRGSGDAYEQSWVQQSDTVVGALQAAGEDDLLTSWQAHVTAHQKIRELDDGGRWDDAVASATRDGDGRSNTTSTAFQDALAPVLDADVVAADGALSDQRVVLWVVAGGVALATLVGTGAALQGLQTRRREYE